MGAGAAARADAGLGRSSGDRLRGGAARRLRRRRLRSATVHRSRRSPGSPATAGAVRRRATAPGTPRRRSERRAGRAAGADDPAQRRAAARRPPRRHAADRPQQPAQPRSGAGHRRRLGDLRGGDFRRAAHARSGLADRARSGRVRAGPDGELRRHCHLPLHVAQQRQLPRRQADLRRGCEVESGTPRRPRNAVADRARLPGRHRGRARIHARARRRDRRHPGDRRAHGRHHDRRRQALLPLPADIPHRVRGGSHAGGGGSRALGAPTERQRALQTGRVDAGREHRARTLRRLPPRPRRRGDRQHPLRRRRGAV